VSSWLIIFGDCPDQVQRVFSQTPHQLGLSLSSIGAGPPLANCFYYSLLTLAVKQIIQAKFVNTAPVKKQSFLLKHLALRCFVFIFLLEKTGWGETGCQSNFTGHWPFPQARKTPRNNLFFFRQDGKRRPIFLYLVETVFCH
jgi:hypothetical protein